MTREAIPVENLVPGGCNRAGQDFLRPFPGSHSRGAKSATLESKSRTDTRQKKESNI